MATSNPQQFKLFSILILVFGAGWIWISAVEPGETTSGDIPAPQKGFLAPDFTLETLAGETLTLSDFRGQGVLVNLWASWCGPCRAEMPAMQRVYDQYKDQGFVVLAVNITSQDSLTNAVAFAEEHNLTYPILLDVRGEVADAYNMRAFPSSYFVDKDGIITEVIIGGPMAEALLEVRAMQLIGETR